ncbi:MAG: hypothetical protein ABFQ65_02555 [Nanoarchaeota archaeon]
MQIETTRMSSRGQIVIPLEMRKDFLEREKFIIIKNNDEIILKKSIPETALLSEKSLAKAWLSKEDEKAFSYFQRR